MNRTVEDIAIPDKIGTKTRNIGFSDLFAPSSMTIPLGDERFHDVEFVPKFDIDFNGISNEIVGINRKIGIKSFTPLSEETSTDLGLNQESSLGSFLLTPSQAVQMMAKSAIEMEPGSVSGICLAANVAAVCTGDPIGFAAVEALALHAALNKVIQLRRVMTHHNLSNSICY